MWRTAARLVTMCTLLLVLGGTATAGATAAEGTPPGLTAAFTVAEVAVGVGVDRTVVLQLTNGTATTATDIDLPLVADPGITIRVRSTVPSNLASGASVALVMDVSRTGDAPASASVQAVVRYVTGSGATAYCIEFDDGSAEWFNGVALAPTPSKRR